MMLNHVRPAPDTRALMIDLHRALPAETPGMESQCEWVTVAEAMAKLSRNPERSVLVVACAESIGEAIETARELRRLFQSDRIAVGLPTRTAPLPTAIRVVELGPGRDSLSDFFARGEERTGCASPDPEFVGTSPCFRRVVEQLEKAAHAPSNVLVTGESGTGKELAAQQIHAGSARADRPSVFVNCAAIPDALFESEMFGYQKGAFTGADHTEDGAFVRSHRGTLILDEISDMSLAAQAKLLRVIETKRVARLGSRIEVPADPRIVALTNRNLEDLVAAGAFRGDLFFRLHVVHIEMPPLRDRIDDLPDLVNHFTRQFAGVFRNPVGGVSGDVLDLFRRHRWPGNVRELRNVMEVAFVNQPGPLIQLAHLPRAFLRQAHQDTGSDESAHILSVLNACQWNKSRAAQKLRWSRMTLYRKMARYHLTPAVAPDPAQM